MSDQQILVEWSSSGGREQISAANAIGDGAKALESAMGTIIEVARHVHATAQHLAGDPQQRELSGVEVQFGLKLDTQMGAFIARAGMEASIVVTLKWERP